MDDLLVEFLTETNESLDVVDVELVKLEQDPNNREVLDNIFRLVHTIKGTCGFLGLPRLESVAHSAENVLGKFRDGELEVTPDAVTVVLESLDRIKEILRGLEATGQEPEGDDSDLIARLDAIAAGRAGGAPAAKPEPAAQGAPARAAASESETAASAGDEDEGDGPYDPGLGRKLKPGEVSLEELERAFQEAPGPDEEGGADSAGGANDNNGAAAAAADRQADKQSAATSGGGARLFERVGGDDSIAVAAHLMAKRIVRDPVLQGFFADVPEDRRKAQFQGLMTALFKENEGAARNVMEKMIGKGGFGDKEFDSLIRLAKSVFEEIQLEPETCDDASMTLEMVRESALESSRRQAKAEGRKADGKAEQGGDGGGIERRSAQSIRVSVELLENLMNLVSELVLTRNQLLQMVREREDSEFTVPIQRLSQTTTELQEGIMKTRMQPIGNAWAKLPRIVRDLSHELDKKIQLEMHGAETELDRQVLELIKDPLTHMVRNSADHGIETPAERVAMGKPETGTIHLNAMHEGGHIIIEISDDGRGISVSKIKKKILEKGLATEAELAEMSENQIQKFIFHPGFSTAEKVTSVSGRGVGMDVVRNNIEKIGGTIDMVSTEGRGTTFRIKIPLTLAIVSALIVEASGERFAIPQISVLELVRVGANSDSRIERIKDTPVLRLRNRLLPLVYLNEILGFKSHEEIMAEEASHSGFIVVTQVGAFTFGIVVDQVFDTEEIVVKPVAPILKHLSVYSGNTILGDGSVIMILDPNGIANLANSQVSDDEAHKAEGEATAGRRREGEKETFLLLRAGKHGRKAVPLSLVARLEDIEIERIEESDGQLVVQYRGSLMPIVPVDGLEALRTEGRQPVIVFTDGDYTMGLAVDEILDIVEDALDIKLGSKRAGIVGSAVIAGKATEIIDVSYYLGKAFGEWLRSRDLNEEISPKRGTRVLLIDDSSFFRNMLRPLLAAAGYELVAVDSAEKALELREEGEEFDLIISDIDMPGMDGFEFAQIVKSGGRWKHTPLVALSSFASEKHLARGRAVGFNDYIAKFDRKALLASLSQQLNMQGDAA